LQKKQGPNINIFILPNGQEAFIADPVLKLLAKPFVSCRLDGEHFERLMTVAYFSPSWTAFQAERGRDFSVIVDGISN